MSDAVSMLRDASAAIEASGGLALGDLDGVVAAVVSGLPRSTWWVPGLRERAGGVLRGASAERLASGAALPPYRVGAAIGPSGSRALYALGLAIAGQPALVHLGAAALADGGVFEALNLAALRDAPLVLVVTTRDLSDAPVPRQAAISEEHLAAGLGVAFVDARGPALAEAVADAVATARPTVVLTSPFPLSSASASA